MQAGKLDRRVQIQQQTATQDAFGQPQQTWTTMATVWASIDIQRGALLYETSEVHYVKQPESTAVESLGNPLSESHAFGCTHLTKA